MSECQSRWRMDCVGRRGRGGPVMGDFRWARSGEVEAGEEGWSDRMVSTEGRQLLYGGCVSGASLKSSQSLTSRIDSEDEIFAFMPPYLPPILEATTLDVLQPRNLPPQTAPITDKSVKWSQESMTFKQSVSTYSSPLVVVGLPPGGGLPKQITFHRRGDYFATVCKLLLLHCC